MRSLTISSPAKLNLFLRVLNKRSDGYHNLLTLFHRISLADTLYLKKAKQGFCLRTNDPKVPTDHRNLVAKAYRLLKQKIPAMEGVRVVLTKRIPAGGGLGGGSSNAAAFLLGMKKLYQLRISLNELVVIGKKIGADVPFFLYGVNQAVAWGRGDEIRLRPSKSRLWFLLVLSNKGLNTKKVYQTLRWKPPAVSLTKENRVVRMLCLFLDRGQIERASGYLRNDLEKPAFYLRPSLRKVMDQLEKTGVPACRMSGSGPTLFAIFSHPREARCFRRKMGKFLRRNKLALVHTEG